MAFPAIKKLLAEIEPPPAVASPLAGVPLFEAGIPTTVAPARTPIASVAKPDYAQKAVAVSLAAAAAALAIVALIMNAAFAGSLGQGYGSSALLALVGLAIDVLAMVLPSAAATLWSRRHFVGAALASLVWGVAVSTTLLATTGFTSQNIGDAFSGRERVSSEAVALRQRLDRIRAERSAITETRTVAQLDTELNRAWPTIPRYVRTQTGDCANVTLPASLAACEPVLRLREIEETAKRRDQLDADITAAERDYQRLPTVATADAGAQSMSDIISWSTGGILAPSPHDVQRVRILGLTVTPALSGLLFGLALVLFRKPVH